MPKVLGPITPDRWEREVRRQLQIQLPDDWIVVCNVAWAVRSDSGFVRDGQCDFVVLVPGLGMAVVEVKGSWSVRVGSDGIWYRLERSSPNEQSTKEVAITEPPPEQANRNMHSLAGIVARYLNLANFPGAYAFLVVYPNGIVDGSTELYDPSTIVDKFRMGSLKRSIENALIARGGSRESGRFPLDVAKKVADCLSNSRFVVKTVDSPLDSQTDSKNIDELTRQQFAALRGAFELPSVAIVGPAGSGKTMLAIWKLQALLEEGKRAIYVCYNKRLAEFLRLKYPEAEDSIWSVDRLFKKIAPDLHRARMDDVFFREDLPQYVMNLAVDFASDNKFDAIIVDEGQDFGELRIIALLELLMPNTAQWLYFCDINQDVYDVGNKGTQGAEVTFRLYHNCRNTERVNRATNRLCELAISAMPGVPSGVPPSIHLASSSEQIASKAWQLAHELAPSGGCVILSPYKLENSCMSNSRRGYGMELTEDISRVGKAGYVYFSTIKSFKGMEAENVILVQASRPGSSQSFHIEDLYVACTRANGRFAIVTTDPHAHEWFSSSIV
jgi:hypothetical protein